MPDTSHIRGVLFDLDGVLYVGAKVIDGAHEAVAAIRRAGYACRFVTNTSTLSKHSLQDKLAQLGFTIPADEIISAPQATVLYLRDLGCPRCRLLLADDVRQDFVEFEQSETAPDLVIVGDIGERWSYSLLNSVFHNLMQGARLIAIHKNRFWQTEQGLMLDIGGFVTALEYATGCETMLIGKPSSDFFRIAVTDMGLPAEQAMMVGDDIDADVAGAQRAGLVGTLVRTGKYRAEYCAASTIRPDIVIDSVADLVGILNRPAQRAHNT